jgi:DNA polymerase-3 subunit gamma/tau
MHALEQQRIAHGYIFSGHRGIGKTTIARILGMSLNCRNPIGSPERPTPEPCGVCDSCKEIRSGSSLDVIEIDAATNRGIDEIRELREAARYAPARDRYKIYLLDEAHQITDAAFNALLKTLEEPPEHVVFMMATTQPEDIPQTIRSRCQHFSFHAVKFDDIVSELTQIAAKEGILADPQALALLAEAGDGSMRDALSIMDQAIASAPMVDGKAKLDGEEIRELMGTVPDAVFERMLEAIGEGQSAALMEELNRLLNAGNSPSQMARQMVRYLRNTLMAKLGGENTELLQISGDERARATRTATIFSEEDLTRFLQVMLRTFDELNYRQEPRLHLELGLMKLVHLQRLLPLEQILSGLPGVARPSTSIPTPRPLPPPTARTEPARPAAPPPPSPFELDRQRKLHQETEDTPPPPAKAEPPVQPARVEPPPAAKMESPVAETKEPAAPVTLGTVDLDAVRDKVAAALDDQGHTTAASLLSDGRWQLDEDGAIKVEVGVKKTMLGLMMNGEAWKIVREALRQAGATQKMTVVPGEGMEPAAAGPSRPRSRDSIEAVALGNPLVRQAQEMFHAEVRSVLDLRDKDK